MSQVSKKHFGNLLDLPGSTTTGCLPISLFRTSLTNLSTGVRQVATRRVGDLAGGRIGDPRHDSLPESHIRIDVVDDDLDSLGRLAMRRVSVAERFVDFLERLPNRVPYGTAMVLDLTSNVAPVCPFPNPTVRLMLVTIRRKQ
jgi:hypothetical protein